MKWNLPGALENMGTNREARWTVFYWLGGSTLFGILAMEYQYEWRRTRNHISRLDFTNDKNPFITNTENEGFVYH